ncbi:hypothetical protein PIB30_012211 [Stylosanthes scabra]|uniref:GRF-type domain-containing protein n=1 Tax=Stylosanthes scabra TaxID=79078 RepID=A0ABU6U4U5_9FABA|nr:hypothetical protein [Stylosanthes scabra]
MDSEGVSTSSKRSGGGRGEDRSSGSTQGFFAMRVTDDKDGAAPKCHCGVYAILYLSKTESNPNRLFFGCPFFKIKMQHCKYFKWLDSHTAKFGRGVAMGGNEAKADVDEHFSKLMIENRLDALESKISAIEKKKLGMSTGLLVMCVIVVFVCVYMIRVSGYLNFHVECCDDVITM